MGVGGFSTYLSRSRRASIFAPIVVGLACVLTICLLIGNVTWLSVTGTTLAALIAASATWARSHYLTDKYVRFAIRARLTKNAEPDFERLARQYRTIGKYTQQSSHPSPETSDALREAEHRMGMRKGSVLALVVPLEFILGVPHNCPAAAAMLYARRHPVILVDDELQKMLDNPDNYEKSFDIVVSVICHELAHLLTWNTRWSRSVGIGDMFVRTAAMIALVTYAVENSFIYGVVGAIIASVLLACEPALLEEKKKASLQAIVARLSLIAWVPYVLTGVLLSIFPLGFTAGVTALSIGLRYSLAVLRRREELYADAIAAIAIGNSSPLSDFFRSLDSHHPNIWSAIFSTHPPVANRIKNLRSLKI